MDRLSVLSRSMFKIRMHSRFLNISIIDPVMHSEDIICQLSTCSHIIVRSLRLCSHLSRIGFCAGTI